jgi:hypothetical protein
MAIVYLALDLRHHRPVAIKVLRPEFAMAIPTERFLREIQIEAKLKHPYILPLFDSGDADGLPYYVMPHVPGGSLRGRLEQETQLPLDEALRITSEVAEALSYAHAQGVVHRDVKPGNILLDESHALLADFGIARAVSVLGGSALSESGLVVGTPQYMSPEQGSQSAKVDGRSDVYSLGCVLYEMLSGEPPFTGPTAQVIVARHMHDRPRGLRVVRSTVPEQVEDAIQRALAKVPADRYPTAAQFVTALRSEGPTGTTLRARAVRRRRWSVGLVAGIGLTAALVRWVAPGWSSAALDPNKVVLFPLTERALPDSAAGAGYDVAVMLSAALEHTQPLRWIDGARHLGRPAATGGGPLPASELRRVAQAQRAGFYIDGTVIGSGHDSTTVILRLHDTSGDSILSQESASAARTEATPVRLGLDAAGRLLPVLVDPGRRIDLSALSARKTSATALWIQGEREYRRSHFREALDFYGRAVGEDSAMAFSALKGAQAANWLNLGEQAERLVAVALAGESSLPSKHRALARGLHAFWQGHADTAVAWISRALVLQSEWAEGHMALGEVYYHLLPETALPLDSLAESEFTHAAAYDSGFAPPLFHLAEAALRRADTLTAGRLIERFRAFDPDSGRRRQLAIMQECVRGGESAVDWVGETAAHPMDVLYAARSLSVGGARNDCAESGFRAILSSAALQDFHWGAVQALHGIAMSEGRYGAVVNLIDSAIAAGHGRAPALYFIGAMAGAPFEARAAATDSLWRALYGESYAEVSPQTKWLVATWYAHRGDTVRVRVLRDALLADSQATRLPIRDALDGHLALARDDTLEAIAHFRRLRVDVPSESVEWGLMEPLAIERLLLARLLAARGDHADAHRVASQFDHASPVTFLSFVRAAIDIRLNTARAAGRSDLVGRYRARLQRLQVPGVTALAR